MLRTHERKWLEKSLFCVIIKFYYITSDYVRLVLTVQGKGGAIEALLRNKPYVHTKICEMVIYVRV